MFLNSELLDFGLNGYIHNEKCSHVLVPVLSHVNGKKALLIVIRGDTMMSAEAITKYGESDIGKIMEEIIKSKLDLGDDKLIPGINAFYVQFNEKSSVRSDLEHYLCGIKEDILLIASCTSVSVLDEVMSELSINYWPKSGGIQLREHHSR